ncbi:MAG: hypothetical protein KatS3mg068_1601 [Candidatus Sericytochromatia bacterium]|nr:MAG: hypothetical protein KatS3mg068_1601 [Candidatus Sericytochromatia bacterium]
MGIFNFLFNKKKEQNIDYQEITDYCWSFFREGLLKENPKVRREIEEALLLIDTPQGKRFFSAGLQEPDLDNKVFCLKNIYKRGGWRLAENLLNIAFSEETDINMSLDIISFMAEFADSSIIDFLIDKDILIRNELKIPIFLCLISSRSKEAINLLEKSINNESELEKILYGLMLYQFDLPDGRKILDTFFIDKINTEYFKFLKYLEFNKSKFYFEKNLDKSKEIQLIIIDNIKDNRGTELIKTFLKSNDKEVLIKSIKKIIEIGSKRLSENIDSINVEDQELNKYKTICKAYFGDKEAINKLLCKVNKNNISDENILEILGYLSDLQENDISNYLNDFLTEKYESFLNNKIDLLLLKKIIKLLIKNGKISSIPILRKYVNKDFLDSNNLYSISSLSAAAILCIIEKNTSYILKKNVKNY